MSNLYKHVGLLTKKADTSFTDFVQYWQTTHADLARGLPGLRKYVINPVDRNVYPDSPVDGFSELWFDSEEAAAAAWASDAGKAAAAEGHTFFAQMWIVNLHEIDVV